MSARYAVVRSRDAKQIQVDAQSSSINPWMFALGLSPLLLIPVLLVASIVTANSALLFGAVHAVLLTLAASIGVRRLNFRPRISPTEVWVDEDTLWVGAKRYDRADFRNAYLVPHDTHTTVRIERKRLQPKIEFRVADWQSGQVALRELGFGVNQTVARFRTMSRIHNSMVRGILVGFGGLIAGGGLMALATAISPALMPVAGLMWFAAMITLMAAPTRLDIGADGLLLRWLGRERFFSYDEIVAVSQRKRGCGNNAVQLVDLTLRNGEQYAIPVTQSNWDTGETSGIQARIRASVAQRRSQQPVSPAALVARGEQSTLEWVRRLRSLTSVGAHRRGAIEVERLWQSVEDHATRAIDRATAALALGSSLSPDERQRMDRVAKAVASPQLRILLDNVAEDVEDEQLAEALQAIEEEEQERESAE